MRILWLKTELLHPIDKGGKIRSYQILKRLKAEHHITYLALDDGPDNSQEREQAGEYCQELIPVSHQPRTKFSAAFYADLAMNLASPLPYFISKYRSGKMRSAIEQQLTKTQFDVVVCDFLMPAVNVPNHLKCATLLFQHNVESLIWKRHYETQRSAFKRAYFYTQWRKAWNFERRTVRRFDHVVGVSAEDAELMQNEYGVQSVSDVPTGVDTDYFRPGHNNATNQHKLVFTGSMDWLPNDDAIRYFTDAILPLIRREIPEVSLTVVGRNPSPELIGRSQRDLGLVVTGRVNDVRPFMDEAAVYVVPLRIGGGTRLKIYEAMAMAKAVVSTEIGAEGLPVRNGTDLLLADTPQDFARAVVKLLKDEPLRRKLGQTAAAKVSSQCGWDKATERFSAACLQAVMNGGGRDHGKQRTFAGAA